MITKATKKSHNYPELSTFLLNIILSGRFALANESFIYFKGIKSNSCKIHATLVSTGSILKQRTMAFGTGKFAEKQSALNYYRPLEFRSRVFGSEGIGSINF